MGERNENKGPLSLDGMLVRDLMPWHEVRARCAACGREELVPVKAIERKIGTLNFVLSAERFLRCSGCGNRNRNKLCVVKLGRD